MSYDNDGDLEYLSTYEDIRKVKVDQAKMLANWDEDHRNPSEIPEGGHPFSPHNLYCNALLDAVVRHRVSDLVISGCDGTPLPMDFRQSVSSAGCNLTGLGWLDIPTSIEERETTLLGFSTSSKD